MTPRQRVRAVLDRRTADRVPIDCGGTDVTGLHGLAYNALKAHLGISEGRTRLFNLYMQLACVEEPVRKRFSADVMRLSLEAQQWKTWTLPDGSPCEVPEGWNPAKLPDGSEALLGPDGNPIIKRLGHSHWFSPTGPTLPFVQTPEDVAKYAQALKLLDRPAFLDESLDDLAERARRIHEETDYAVVGAFGAHIFAAAQIIRGMSNFMCDLALNEKMVHALLDTLAESHMEEFERYIERLGPYVDVVAVADDLGAQQGPQIDPRMWRKLVKPYMAKLYKFMKSKMDTKLFLHSCGSVYDFIPDLIEMGVDVLNPVQVSARNMDSAKLKAEFGREIIFWGGGCDTQRVLPRGTVDEVREEVKRRIGDLAPEGGFVFAQVHNTQPGVPPENIVAMFDAALEFGAC